MKDSQTLIIAMVAAGCFVIACVTGLVALGRDATQVMYLVGTTLPGTIAGIAALRASNKARSSADNAAEVASAAGDAALNAAEHAANSVAAQTKMSIEMSQLQARIGGRRATDPTQ